MSLHIGNLIRQRLEEVGMSKAEFARRINTSSQNIYGIFKRKSIDTSLLKRISEIMEFDFFRYYTAQENRAGDIKAKYGKEKQKRNPTQDEIISELAFLKKENEILLQENAYLKEINTLLKSRQKQE